MKERLGRVSSSFVALIGSILAIGLFIVLIGEINLSRNIYNNDIKSVIKDGFYNKSERISKQNQLIEKIKSGDLRDADVLVVSSKCSDCRKHADELSEKYDDENIYLFDISNDEEESNFHKLMSSIKNTSVVKNKEGRIEIPLYLQLKGDKKSNEVKIVKHKNFEK